MIAHRLGKYKQPGHPNRIDRDDFKELYKKSLRQIIDAERKVCLPRFVHTLSCTRILMQQTWREEL